MLITGLDTGMSLQRYRAMYPSLLLPVYAGVIFVFRKMANRYLSWFGRQGNSEQGLYHGATNPLNLYLKKYKKIIMSVRKRSQDKEEHVPLYLGDWVFHLSPSL